MTSRFQMTKCLFLFVMFHFILHSELCKLYLRPETGTCEGGKPRIGGKLCETTLFSSKNFPELAYGSSDVLLPQLQHIYATKKSKNVLLSRYFRVPTLHTPKRCLKRKAPSSVRPVIQTPGISPRLCPSPRSPLPSRQPTSPPSKRRSAAASRPRGQHRQSSSAAG